MTKSVNAFEANFDGLIGPTHNYGGLSQGNIASQHNAAQVSKPKEAALEGLLKMKFLADKGMVQGVLPPHERPHVPTLKKLGFSGSTDRDVVINASETNPLLYRNVCSASSMWTANAATVSPSADTQDGRVHFTPANLTAMFHRSIEPVVTGRMLQSIFADETHFAHHSHLPGATHFGDEGAANHNRFCSDYGLSGVELFVYGKEAFVKDGLAPKKFPARQTYETGRAVERLHGLNGHRTVHVQQNPEAIDAGAFHNDVVAVSNKNVFFYHEKAFVHNTQMQDQLRTAAPDIDFHFIEVPANRVPIQDAIKSYLFNSQLLNLPGSEGQMTLLLPVEAKETPSTFAYLQWLEESNHPIKEVSFIDVRQSMSNGGGPACLRLRVVMTEKQKASIKTNNILTDTLFKDLSSWVEKHYRDELSPEDLLDPNLLDESRTALDELTQIMNIGSIYDFQRG